MKNFKWWVNVAIVIEALILLDLLALAFTGNNIFYGGESYVIGRVAIGFFIGFGLGFPGLKFEKEERGAKQ